MRVLLVEDDPVTATIEQALLEGAGFTCDVADLGEIGLALAESYSDYDVIVLDLVLPDVMGYELIPSLRSAGVKTPILIVSSLHDASKTALEMGADDFLPKPFQDADLIARIRAVAARPRAA
ncbi:MAG: response regulator [Rhizobiales bacterium]|nr:response regulator [Hyphomicrobiales bacterium]